MKAAQDVDAAGRNRSLQRSRQPADAALVTSLRPVTSHTWGDHLLVQEG